MNKVTLCISTLALIFSIGCSEPKESPDESYADFKSIELVKKRAAHFKQLGRITKAVKLEITDNSFINYINKIMIDKATGDILVIQPISLIFQKKTKSFSLNYTDVSRWNQ